MEPLRRKVALIALMLGDVLVMVIAFVIGAAIVSYEASSFSFSAFVSMRIKVQNFIVFLGLLGIWHIIFSSYGLYHSRRISSRGSETSDILQATAIGVLISAIVSVFLGISMATPLFLVVFWLAASLLTITWRLALRYLLGWLRIKGRNLRFMVIVGTNQRGLSFAREIEEKPEYGYRIIGFVDDEWTRGEKLQEQDYPLLANLKDFPAFLRDHVVDEVVICLPIKSLYDHMRIIVEVCEEQGIIVKVLSGIFDLKSGRLTVEQFGNQAFTVMYTGAMNGSAMLVKRLLDFSLSLALLIFLAPVLLAIAILIKVSSPGPVFFVQERVGINKRRFRMYKFRTMIPAAEEKLAELEDLNEMSGPVFKIKDDPRITRVGKLLRSWSLDELPQLINVLKGDMGLVGPRPLPVRDYNGFDQDWQRRRFSVRPGLTCLWQISGRCNLPFERWMELDLEYIDRWSLWLDLKILVKSIPAVIKGTGAG